MERLRDLERAVEALPEQDYTKFRRWFMERDWERWDEEIEEDLASGKLDFLLREAEASRQNGTLMS